MKLTIITAHDLNFGIGYENKLPWHLPADMAFFKAKTLGKAILMGRKTFESIGRPLPGRRNLVLTSSPMRTKGIEVLSDINDCRTLNIDELMIIGGSSVYQYFLPMIDEMFVTEVKANAKVDTYFPVYEKGAFEETVLGYHSADEINQYAMEFKHYIRNRY